MRNFAAIDFETANGKRTSICSVGVVIVKEGKIINKINSYRFYPRLCETAKKRKSVRRKKAGIH